MYVRDRRGGEPPETRDLGLLRVRHERPRRSRATEHRGEFASSHRPALKSRTTPYHIRVENSGAVHPTKNCALMPHFGPNPKWRFLWVLPVLQRMSGSRTDHFRSTPSS